MKVLAILSALLVASSAEYLSRCEFANMVRNSRLMNFGSLADWVCLVNYESSFQTNAVSDDRNSAGQVWSADYGIFQINSYWWCYEPGFPNAGNGCNVNCQDLFNVQTAINCAAVVAEQQGLEAWYGWLNNCRGRSIQHFVEGC
ncbi:lysozyme C-1/C-2-like [Hemitrygon akajei]|uniref:lysozyme C-1/C-2-like n=1 Tax=Hemitrygon akajei TaxID=2704970 RepID=UPI003BFA230C